jgi:uncharacterized protein
MGQRTQYTPGTFCWTDLTTIDQGAAKDFYQGLFGWEAEDMPIPGGGSYSMMRLGGQDVAAIAPQPPQQRDAGVPAAWNSYVSVDDADAVANRAAELGGTVHAPPFDVMDAGRMAVIQDPQGAFFLAWQPRRHAGAARVNEPGAFVWNELASPDLAGSREFYNGLFGWTTAPFEGSEQPYLFIRNGDANNGGMRELRPPEEPPHWLTYFGTDDVDATLGRVGRLGGTTLAGPFDMEGTRIAVAQDPQGAVFALYQGEFQP